MEVKIVRREMVKPSSPTPEHLRTHNLSSLEQSKPRLYYPTLFFYPQPPEESQEIRRRLELLKLSLSRLLVSFYPFAGTLETKEEVFSVHCDDHGVPFIQAEANFSLHDYLRRPDLRRLPDFAPQEVAGAKAATCPHVALVQLTLFSCGGSVISASVDHLVADAASVSFFLSTWTVMCRSDLDLERDLVMPPPPIFNASALFPPAETVPEEVKKAFRLDPFKKQVKKLAVRRVVFGPAAVRDLQEKSATLNPTAEEAVTAHLSNCIMSVLKKETVAISQAVNLRRRADPPFPDELIGYLMWAAVAPQVAPGNDLVKEIRSATDKIDGEFMTKSSSSAENVFEERRRSIAGAAPGNELIAFTSRCNIGLYDVDFGWGKPIWVTYIVGPPIGSTVMFTNLVVLMDTAGPEDGVEAYLFLDEADLALMDQAQQVLIKDSAFDPSPLHHHH